MSKKSLEFMLQFFSSRIKFTSEKWNTVILSGNFGDDNVIFSFEI